MSGPLRLLGWMETALGRRRWRAPTRVTNHDAPVDPGRNAGAQAVGRREGSGRSSMPLLGRGRADDESNVAVSHTHGSPPPLRLQRLVGRLASSRELARGQSRQLSVRGAAVLSREEKEARAFLAVVAPDPAPRLRRRCPRPAVARRHPDAGCPTLCGNLKAGSQLSAHREFERPLSDALRNLSLDLSPDPGSALRTPSPPPLRTRQPEGAISRCRAAPPRPRPSNPPRSAPRAETPPSPPDPSGPRR